MADGGMALQTGLEEKTLRVLRVGTLSYEDGLQLQHSLRKQREAEQTDDTLVLLEHPHVITLGTRGVPEDIVADEAMLRTNGVSVSKTSRGGQVTIHSPGQLVGYCIFHLYKKQRALREFIASLENALIDALRDFGISARAGEHDRGVWVDEKKIASIGISVSGGVTMHGFALNVRNDLRAFSWIVPCGIKNARITSIANEIRHEGNPGATGASAAAASSAGDNLMAKIQDAVQRALAARCGYTRVVAAS